MMTTAGAGLIWRGATGHCNVYASDPSFVITHRVTFDDAPEAYETFRDKREHCIKVVMKPGAERVH